ncbi:unnamed protein product [Mesocestoides corti]|uniref:Alkaline phosphatase n=1 Tax=Mesocestoides corti TaxID=53468 RepID=A0A158QW40_MESCO|nr:unnamed protein product [Mesocestoides corti]
MAAAPVFLRLLGLLALIVSTVVVADQRPINSEEISPAFWERLARQRFQQSRGIFGDGLKTRARNVILFLGDGMGVPTVSAGRFYKTEVGGQLGLANPTLDFENWPFATLCKTYDLQTVVTDSASSATAYLGGTKTSTKMLGVTGAVKLKSCRKYLPEEKVDSVLKAAVREGLATGIVTTSRVTHASPAGAYAHVASRGWESDKKLKADCKGAKDLPLDIARQLVEENPDVNVVLGGGMRCFYPEGRGERLDNRSVADEWLSIQIIRSRRAKLITDPSKFLSTDFSKVDYLMGLLYPSHMPYDGDRKDGDPSLANLTVVALEILKRQPNGFFLFVEGARIDHAHHDNKGKKALEDLLAFEEAIREAVKMVDLEETLIIVTADHSHSFTLVGQPGRSESLLDRDTSYDFAIKDDKGMLPVIYASGPAAAVNETRRNVSSLSNEELHDADFRQPALVPIPWATHAGEDVGVYAVGPSSWLFHSTVDNTFVAQAMKYALCLEPFNLEVHCASSRPMATALLLLVVYVVLRNY